VVGRTELGRVAILALALGCGNRPLRFGGNLDAAGEASEAGVDAMDATGSDGAAAHDTCASNADCPAVACAASPCPEAICARLDDGLRHCTSRVHASPPACPDSVPTCCVSDVACPSGQACLRAAQLPGVCVGIPAAGNFCVADECQSDTDCMAKPNGACTAGYPRKCAYGPCRTNSDCTAGPGGVCLVDLSNVVATCLFPVVFCHYKNDPCRTDADCPAPKVCAPGAGLAGTTCVDQVPPPS
jgi:hypothetical protein